MLRNRHCQECGMLLDHVGEYHPYSFCVLKKSGLDPWREVRLIAAHLQIGDPGEKPPTFVQVVYPGTDGGTRWYAA